MTERHPNPGVTERHPNPGVTERHPNPGVARNRPVPRVGVSRVTAFAKVNLALFLGPTRSDGRHELVTLFESVDLADELVVTEQPGGPDEVVCLAVSGPNLVSDALAALREAGWSAPPVRVEIEKRIPVAAGMGGGSADAAAMLRHAPTLAPIDQEVLTAIAARLGADVPSQLSPGPTLGTGAGEIVRPVSTVAEHGVLVIPRSFELSTADVYREADRLGLPRRATGLATLRADLEAALEPGSAGPLPATGPLPAQLTVNDLQPAALSLRPEIGESLDAARSAGAGRAMVCGSGPTVIGIFWGPDGSDRAERAADGLTDRFPGARGVRPVLRGIPGWTPND